MEITPTSAKRIRTFGVTWIVLAPVVFLMAAISTVRSEVTYLIQLAVFSGVAAAAVTFGFAAVLRQSWSGMGLFALSCLGAAYFFGSAIFVLVWPSLLGPTARIGVALLIAPWGIPFFLMARTIRRLITVSSA